MCIAYTFIHKCGHTFQKRHDYRNDDECHAGHRNTCTYDTVRLGTFCPPCAEILKENQEVVNDLAAQLAFCDIEDELVFIKGEGSKVSGQELSECRG